MRRLKEYYNGLVYSGDGGTGTGEEKSDSHEVAMTISFREIDEMLPNGVLDPNEVGVVPTYAPAAMVA